MKKIILLIVLVGSISMLFGFGPKTNPSDWELKSDGYYYFVGFPQLKQGASQSFDIQVDEGWILEVKDFDTGSWNQLLDINDSNKLIYKINVTLKQDTSPGYSVITYKVGSRSWSFWPVGNFWDFSITQLKEFIQVRTVKTITDLPDSAFTTVADLTDNVKTTTTGNYLVDMGAVTYTVDGKTVVLNIEYFKTYRIKFEVNEETDMSLFDNSKESYYINIDGNPMVYTNQSTDKSIKQMIANKDESFVPHSIWYLKTNELKNYLQFKTYTYIKQNDTTAVVAYFYTDAFIIDNLTSIHVTWTQRTRYSFPEVMWNGSYSEWTYNEQVLRDDKYLTYKKNVKDFNYWNFWPLAIFRNVKEYKMPQIEAVNFNASQSYYNVTKFELDTRFKSLDADFKGVTTDKYKVFGLALGQGTTNSGQTEIYHNALNPQDPLNFHVITFNYETNGRNYVVEGKEIDNSVIPSKPLEPTNPDDIVEVNWPMVFVMIATYLLILYLSVQFGLFSTKITRLIVIAILMMATVFFWPHIKDLYDYITLIKLL